MSAHGEISAKAHYYALRALPSCLQRPRLHYLKCQKYRNYSDMAIDTMNKFGVCVASFKGEKHLFLMTSPQTPYISADDALNLAAWLVAIAEDSASHTFAEVLEAIQSV
jgi:hypothetical protein